MDGARHVQSKASYRLLLILQALLTAPAQAGGQAWEACFDAAGQRYGIAPALLRAIAQVESNLDPAARRSNRDGSRDIGIMQINTRWLPELARYGITEKGLASDVCLNIHVGAWILALEIRRFGYGWEAVGAYHAGAGRDEARRIRRARYALRVHRRLAADRPGGPVDDGLRAGACPVSSVPGGPECSLRRPGRVPLGRDPVERRHLDPVSGLSSPHTFAQAGG
ncbi:MAG: invasion protein IagB [Caldilineae bacterium]|nr:MAG: invasion protein IagB [Caldilineae bacterium]